MINKMIKQISRYESYKDSGVDWIGKIPQEWDVVRLGGLFRERRTKVSDLDVAALSVTKKGILPQLDSAAKTKHGDNRKLVRCGDFVINSRSDRKGSSGVSDRDGSVSLINIVLEPQKIKAEFCHHLLKSNAFIEEYYRVGRGIVADLWTTRYDEMRTISLALPSKTEQVAIAKFLDKKTVQIDEAIAIKQKQIELLKERKQIIIQQAVTQGLNPDVPMKESGVDWIGEIPEHWEAIKLKHLFKETTSRTKTGEETLLSLRMERGLVPHNEVSDKPISAENLIDYKMVEPGQMVMNRMRAAIGIFGIPSQAGLVSPDYAVYNVSQEIVAEFYLLLFKTQIMGTQFRLASKGMGTGSSGFMRLYNENFGNIKVPFAPSVEQKEILEKIEKDSSKLNRAIDNLNLSIDKLKEYKTTLINSAVTGKIKVTELA